MLGHKCGFPNSRFPDPGCKKQRKVARHQQQNPQLPFQNLFIQYHVSASNCFLNRLNLRLLFFRRFPHGECADCKKTTRLTTQISLVYSFTFVYLICCISFSIQLEAHQDILKILMGKNKQKPKLEPCYEKRELRGRSSVIFTMAPQPCFLHCASILHCVMSFMQYIELISGRKYGRL